MKEEVKLLKELIMQDTTNPLGNEYRAAKVVTDFFDENKISYNTYEKVKGRTNVVARIGNGKKLLFAAHLDVVPGGDGWDTNAFKPVIKKNRLYGRGAVDNKGPLASMLVVAKYLKKIEHKLKVQIVFAAVADEELGNVNGMKFLMDEGILNPDYAIIPDISGNCLDIDVAEKGSFFFNLTAYGKQAHGSRPDLGINAIEMIYEFNNMIRKSNFLKQTHKILGKGSVNLGLIDGGAKHNMVPGKCKAGFDVRYVKGNMDIVLTELKDIAEKIGKFEFEILNHHGPTEVDPNNVLVKLIQKNVKKTMGKTPKTIGLEGSTVCKDLIDKGILAVGWSCGDKELPHCANESIDITELSQFTLILRNIVLDFNKSFLKL